MRTSDFNHPAYIIYIYIKVEHKKHPWQTNIEPENTGLSRGKPCISDGLLFRFVSLQG